MTIVDTCVWIDHFRRPLPALDTLLAADDVLLHPFVLGELALGGLPGDSDHARSLQSLPAAPVIPLSDVVAFISSEEMTGRGIGYVDVHLLASATVSGAQVMTTDQKLHRQAHRLGIAFPA